MSLHHPAQQHLHHHQTHSLLGGLNSTTTTNSANNIGISSTATTSTSSASNGLNLNLPSATSLHSIEHDQAISQASLTDNSILSTSPANTLNLGLLTTESNHRGNLHSTHSDLGMSHWLSESATATSVKSETRSPTLDTSGINSLVTTGLSSSTHLDSTSLFCSNPSSSGLDALQGSSSFDQKQEYYNYYNGMQQYTPSFYSSYAAPYPPRTPKLSSPNSYLPTGYASAAAAAAVTNNNASQLYSSYAYSNFGQFGGTQQDYNPYYNDQYTSYYNQASYSPYGSSPGSSGSQGFHVTSGLPESPSDGHPTTPTLLTHSHSPHSSLSISPNTPSISAKSTPTTKTGRTRGRRHAHPSPTRSLSSENGQAIDNGKAPERVFIWDLDETIIIFHTLITGFYAGRYGKDPTHMQILGNRMEELIFNLADHHFFFNDIESCDQVHIDDVSSDDNGQELTNYNFNTDGFHTNSTPGKIISIKFIIDKRLVITIFTLFSLLCIIGVPGNLCLPTGVRGGVDWMRKLAFRYRKIKDIYNMYKNK